jgi:hypothetical protein
VRARADLSAAVDDDDKIRAGDRAYPLRDYYPRHARKAFGYILPYVFIGFEIERGKTVVENVNVCFLSVRWYTQSLIALLQQL